MFPLETESIVSLSLGFNDALHSLNRLSAVDFHLPIDTSVRRFVHNEDLIE